MGKNLLLQKIARGMPLDFLISEVHIIISVGRAVGSIHFVATGFNPLKKVTRDEPMSAVGTVHLKRR